MTMHLPKIGVTSCTRAISLLEEYPQNIVGSFWVMCDYGLDDKEIPKSWIHATLFEDNPAQSIINAYERYSSEVLFDNTIYLGFCIVVIADSSNPTHLSYVIEYLSMSEKEGIRLLRIMAHYNIPAETEVVYPEQFLNYRYGEESPTYKYLRETLSHWSVQVWEDYCSYLMAQHGKWMFSSYCKTINAIKDKVKATVEKGTKPLVLTEGETDPIYIKTALELLGKKDILEQIDIEWVGASRGKGQSINTGDSGLNNSRDVLIAKPQFLTRKVLLLYDCDTKKSNEDHEKLKIRKIPEQENRKIKKGIENLFPDHLFTEDFYIVKTKYGDYGEENKIQEFQKMKFCKWICEERRKAEDFADFKVIIDIIKESLGTIVY